MKLQVNIGNLQLFIIIVVQLLKQFKQNFLSMIWNPQINIICTYYAGNVGRK